MTSHEIATMLGADDLNTSLGEPGRIVVFRRSIGIWEIDRKMEFALDQCRDLREMRQKMADLLLFLGGVQDLCRRSGQRRPLLRTGEGPGPGLGDRRKT